MHTSVAGAIVATLMRRGLAKEGLRYGSAFSGIDTFAAGLEEELGAQWEYTFASESDPTTREALVEAWQCRGLTREHCYKDARKGEALTAPKTDLFVLTAECEAHSKRNHHRSSGGQKTSLVDIWAALGYVRKRRPSVVVVENVTDVSATGGITGLLERLDGYELESGELDPREVAGMPVARERKFWVLYSA